MLTPLPKLTLKRNMGRVWSGLATALLGTVFLLILLTFRHYGVSWDEELQSQYGQAVFDYYASGFTDRDYNQIFNLHYYGGLFDGIAGFVNAYTPFDIYATRHLLNAFMGLVGLWGTWRLGRMIGGGRVGFLAVLLLALTPMYYGHMFNNPKDIPFAAGVVWSLFYMTKTIRLFPRIAWGLTIRLGIVLGLTLGVRVGGVMLLGYWGLALTLHALWLIVTPSADLLLEERRVIPMAKRLLMTMVPATVLAYVVMLLCWPWAQENPILNPLLALQQFSNFPQDVEVLLGGTIYRSTQLPWTYIPQYFGVQLPVLHLVLLMVGFFLSPTLWRHIEPRANRHALLMMSLMAFVPLIYAVIRRPALYDAVRHFLFVLPLICLWAALVLDFLLRFARHRFERNGEKIVALWLVLMAAPVAIDMVRLHPYEYIYLNEIEGGSDKGFGQYELDYWGSSFKEAAEQLQAFVEKEGGIPDGQIYRVAICGPWSSATIYLPPNYEAVIANKPAEFFLTTTRWMCQNMRPGKEIIHIERQGVPLSLIKDLRGETWASP